MKEGFEQRLEALQGRKDNMVTIAELGIDQIIVDEAQEFQKLFLSHFCWRSGSYREVRLCRAFRYLPEVCRKHGISGERLEHGRHPGGAVVEARRMS